MVVCAKFGKNVYLPKDAEFYFIYNGSHQRHIVIAERKEDNVLQSSIPGEACVFVCVCVYSHWVISCLRLFQLCLQLPRKPQLRLTLQTGEQGCGCSLS